MDYSDIAFRFDNQTDAGEFSGHAVIWGERNAHNEIYRRGAFARSLEEHRAAGTRPVMLWSHIPSEIIGVWNEVREDEKGLFVRGQILTQITSGRDAWERVKANALNGLSIGFRKYPNGVQMRAGVSLITSIDVREISLVGNPSASGARITSIRSSGRETSAAAFIDACRKAQCALVSKGK